MISLAAIKWKENSIQFYDRVSQPPERNRLFDHLVRPEQHRLRNRHADLLCRFQIDHQLELRRLLYRKVCGFGALENFIHIGGGAAEQLYAARPIGHEATRLYKLLFAVHRYQPLVDNEV